MRGTTPFLFLCMLALAGCSDWAKPGVSPQVRGQDLADCETQAEGAHPVLAVSYSEPGHYQSSRYGSQETSKGQKESSDRVEAWIPPINDTMDGNAGARDTFIKACMRRKGYARH